ncbi:MAG TPA: hypothetical protein VFP98_04390, partial [Candidatus Polarisedimenticolia bacterium]|nr:hypothetical protein [Candidatus Polarisedimenticolia bacterium]
MPVTRVRARLFVHALAVSIAAIPSSALSAPAAEDPDPDFSLEETVQAGPFHLAPFLVIKDF